MLLGSPADPARIGQLNDAPHALAQIAQRETAFASRGDDSGTHAKELSVWEAAGVEPSGSWYFETGRLSQSPPAAGDRRAVSLDPGLATLVG